MSKIQCPKCKKYIQVDLMAHVYNCEIPKHDCVDNESVTNDDLDLTINQIAIADIVLDHTDDFNSSSYDSANDNSSDTDTSSSDIGGGGDFGGGGASSDY